MFLKIYNKIIDVIGTINNITDESLLNKNYNLNTFKIPRNNASKKTNI